MNTWNSRWANLSTPLHRYISSPSTNPIGHDLHRHCWARPNRMSRPTGYGRLGQQMVRMGLATDPSCSCGCAVQTAHHAIYDCPITRCPGDFTTLDLRARDWLHTTQLNMWHVVHVTRSINQYSRTPLIRPPSESHWCGRIRGMVAREGFVYEQKPLSVTRNVVVWEGWSLVRVVVRQGFYCIGYYTITGRCIQEEMKRLHMQAPIPNIAPYTEIVYGAYSVTVSSPSLPVSRELSLTRVLR